MYMKEGDTCDILCAHLDDCMLAGRKAPVIRGLKSRLADKSKKAAGDPARPLRGMEKA